jgi:RNA polymerase sigma factor (sigma-70 family)
MATRTTDRFIEQLRRTVLFGQASPLPDSDLLGRFVQRRDEAAFEALVRRHGPMVFGVCRRVLRHEHDTEDAFQATFMVLARKAPSVRPRDMLGNWLYGVAQQTALRCKALNAKRHHRETPVAAPPETATTFKEHDDLQSVLDQELSRLPDKYRVAIVICDLEGKTRKEAARQLGWPEGSVAGRLARARGLLAKRLTRRGIALSGGALAGQMPLNTASASLPLVVSTSKAALLFAASQAASGVISIKAAALAEGVLKAMMLTKLKSTIALLLILAFATAGGGLSVYGNDEAKGAAPPNKGQARQADQPTSVAANQAEKMPTLLTWQTGPTLQGHGGQLVCVAFSPDGRWLVSGSRDKSVLVWDVAKRVAVQTLRCDGEVFQAKFSPDGKALATASGSDDDGYCITFWDSKTWKEQVMLKDHENPIHTLSFSLDGKILVATSCPWDFTRPIKDRGEVSFWDAATKKKIAALQYDNVTDAALSHDQRKLLTTNSDPRGNGTVKLIEIDAKFATRRESVLVADRVVCGMKFAPDAKSFVITPVSDSAEANLWDVDTEKVFRSFKHAIGSVRSDAFSPDGKTIATGLWIVDNKEVRGAVTLWDVATGKEKQTLTKNLGPVTSLAFSPDGKTLAVGLLHKENIKLKAEGGFEVSPENQTGVVVLCELKRVQP